MKFLILSIVNLASINIGYANAYLENRQHQEKLEEKYTGEEKTTSDNKIRKDDNKSNPFSFIDENGTKYRNLAGHFTGVKEEVFCKNVGPVYAKATHNSGVIYKVSLIQSNIEMWENNSYNLIKEGKRKFHFLSNEKQTTHEIIMLKGSLYGSNSVKNTKTSRGNFKLKEVYSINNQSLIQEYETSWARRHAANYNRLQTDDLNHGGVIQILGWGTSDLGYSINFQVGYKDKGIWYEPKIGLDLTGHREVSKHIDSYKVLNKTYNDCFIVDTIISLNLATNKHPHTIFNQ